MDLQAATQHSPALLYCPKAIGALAISALSLLITSCISETSSNQFDVSPFSTQGAKEPFSSSVYPAPGILTQDSPSTYISASYQELAERSMFDSRTDVFSATNAYVYSITFSDGDTLDAIVNAEFGSEAIAMIEAQRYGTLVGQLPSTLRSGVEELWIHKGQELWGSETNALYIHTDVRAEYEAANIVEETLLHEAVHVALDEQHESSDLWKAAQVSDDNFISTYAKDNADTEDFSESFLMWMALRFNPDALSADIQQRIEQAIPARLSYLDQQGFNMNPVGP